MSSRTGFGLSSTPVILNAPKFFNEKPESISPPEQTKVSRHRKEPVPRHVVVHMNDHGRQQRTTPRVFVERDFVKQDTYLFTIFWKVHVQTDQRSDFAVASHVALGRNLTKTMIQGLIHGVLAFAPE